MKSRSTRHGKKATGCRRNGPTLRDILEDTREESARRAWDRAILASDCRHDAVRRGRGRLGAYLSGVKISAARRAYELAPERIRIGIDGDYQVGMVSVTWEGGQRMHLPPDVDTSAWSARQNPANHDDY